ncbi:ATP-binding cassette domain-containing protein [Microlunatus flavus]|uniref:ABC transporter n=1 Tax=Microlunatus flavus TaxID=1036181 RepID=A0A1H9L4G5_9ACTN|nr:ATP-binding cassette domain-containing protein [Microlunatus flavus]SER06045.1 ABC transporter [Microlunatus flavus]
MTAAVPQPETETEPASVPAPEPEPGPTPPPLLEAEGLSLVGPEGPVFTDVSFAVEPGRVTLLVGPAGTGRSSLLLALSGRMQGTTGLLRHHGRPVRSRRDLRNLRRASAVARAAELVVPEARLSVAESVAERALLDGVRPAAAERAFVAAEELLDVRLDRTLLVEQLPAYEVTALCVALALVRPAELVVLDDLDADLDLTDQRRLLDALVRLAGGSTGTGGTAGPAVVATSTEARATHPDALLVPLAPPQEDR